MGPVPYRTWLDTLKKLEKQTRGLHPETTERQVGDDIELFEDGGSLSTGIWETWGDLEVLRGAASNWGDWGGSAFLLRAGGFCGVSMLLGRSGVLRDARAFGMSGVNLAPSGGSWTFAVCPGILRNSWGSQASSSPKVSDLRKSFADCHNGKCSNDDHRSTRKSGKVPPSPCKKAHSTIAHVTTACTTPKSCKWPRGGGTGHGPLRALLGPADVVPFRNLAAVL